MQEKALGEDRALEALEASSPSAGLPSACVIQRREQKRAAERGRAVGRGRAEGAEDGRQEPVPDCFQEMQSGLLQDSVIARRSNPAPPRPYGRWIASLRSQ